LPNSICAKPFSDASNFRRSGSPAWFNVPSETRVTIPQVDYPPITGKAAVVKTSLQECVLEAFDGGGSLMVHFPCSIGRMVTTRPAGE
jgi:hypothetical protein